MACAKFPDCRLWILLHPLTAPVLHGANGASPVGPELAGEIAKFPFPRNDTICTGAESSSFAKLINLVACQHPCVTGTKKTMMIWAASELVAVTGIAATHRTIAEIHPIASEVGQSLKRIHEHESLRQQLCANRHLSMHFREPLLFVRGDGQIVMASESGWDSLYKHLRCRPSKKNPIRRLPSNMIEALLKSGKTVLGALAMTVYPLPDDNESALPMRVVFLEPATHVQSSNFDQRVAALTPTQRATYQLVLAGKRDKEIADALGIAYRTATHHVAAVLAKTACGDRLQLMATAAQHHARKVFPALAMVEAPVMADLPRTDGKVAARV